MYTQDDVKQVQNRLLKMAVTVKTVLERESIPYFLSSGSLLGAVRHKGFIPWDDDLDFYLFSDTYEKALSALQNNLPDDMFLEYDVTEPKYFHDWAHVKCTKSLAYNALYPQDSCYTHKGLSIDLYKMTMMKRCDWPFFKHKKAIEYIDKRIKKGFIDEIEYAEKKSVFDNQLQNHVKSLVLNDNLIFGSSVSRHIFKYEDILPLTEIMFEGETFKAPHHPEDFLAEIYGNYMKLPPEEERKPHYSSVIFLN